MKNVLIPYDLYQLLLEYHLSNDTSHWQQIRRELEEKEESRSLHELYTRSKNARTEDEKEQTRQEYLDRKGVPENFRWQMPSGTEKK